MDNLRKYGRAPFTIAIVHGGPGGAGEVAPVAQELSKMQGILEPLQTALTIEDQLHELKDVIQKRGTPPMTLIGHSWGAWLSFIFAARNPSLVKKLILVSSGPFEASYATNIMKTRLNRLSIEDQAKLQSLLNTLNDSVSKNKDATFTQLGKYIARADSYDPLPHQAAQHEGNYAIYKAVDAEAKELRRSGKLLTFGKQIQCPVIAIHGDYDPHPYEGVQKPLSGVLKSFRFILLKNCGHTPWNERDVHEEFYRLLTKEL
ncbi:MAG: alpha/beta hydrolase [Candidatus Babeliales bacterium]|jgi:pimeloyl-ACP methyl ester carboxylesterase